MAKRIRSAEECATSVVRLFSGWADSPVWFSGPIAYGDTQLDDDLVADLRRWDSSYYAALTSEYDWANPDDATRYYREGARLARRLADQIGDDFQVEHDLAHTHHRVRAPGPALNPKAAAAFHEMADRAIGDRAHTREAVERARARGDVLHWSANP